MLNPEDLLIYSSEPKENLSLAEEKIYDELVWKKKRPKLKNFQKYNPNIYTELEIQRDIKRVKKIKQQFDNKPTKRSRILEALLEQQIEKNDWFGWDCGTSETTEYDDYVNHTDLIAEWREDDGPIYLAIDVTCSEEKYVLDNKAKKIIKDLGRHKGTYIKYFYSEELESGGPITDIPRVVLGIDKFVLDDFCKLSLPAIQPKKQGERTAAYQKLAAYPLQILIIEEIIKQLDEQVNYLEQINDKNSKVYQNLNKIISLLEKLFDKKIGSFTEKSLRRASEVFDFSPFLRRLREQL